MSEKHQKKHIKQQLLLIARKELIRLMLEDLTGKKALEK